MPLKNEMDICGLREVYTEYNCRCWWRIHQICCSTYWYIFMEKMQYVNWINFVLSVSKTIKGFGFYTAYWTIIKHQITSPSYTTWQKCNIIGEPCRSPTPLNGLHSFYYSHRISVLCCHQLSNYSRILLPYVFSITRDNRLDAMKDHCLLFTHSDQQCNVANLVFPSGFCQFYDYFSSDKTSRSQPQWRPMQYSYFYSSSLCN